MTDDAIAWFPPRTWGYDDCLPLGTPGVWAKDRLGWCIREARPPELVCLATPERTTAAGLVLPESCWSDECRPPRSPHARAMAGAFDSFTACLIVDWFGAQCDDAGVERKTVVQRCLPYEGPRLSFGEFDENGMRICGRPSTCMGQTSCPECHGDPTPPRCPRCDGRGWIRFR